MRSLGGIFLWAPAVSVGAGILLAVVPIVPCAEAKSAHQLTFSQTLDVQINLSRVLALRGDAATSNTSDSISTTTKRNRRLKEDNKRDGNVEEGGDDCDKECQKALKKAKKDEEKAMKKAEKEATKAAQVAQEATEEAQSESIMKENVFVEDMNNESSEEIPTVEDLNLFAPVTEPEPEVETMPLNTTASNSDEVFLQEMPNSSQGQGGIRGMTPVGKFGISLVFIALFALIVFAAFQLQAYAKRKDFRVGIPRKKMNELSDDGTKNNSAIRANGGTTEINTSTDTNSGLHKELDDLVEYLRVVEASTEDTDICAFEEGEGFEVWS